MLRKPLAGGRGFSRSVFAAVYGGSSPYDLTQQPFGLPLQRHDVGPDRLQRAHRLGLVDSLRVDAVDAQRTLNGELPVAEGGVVEDLGLLAFFKTQEAVADAVDVGGAELAVLLAEVLAQRPVPQAPS